MNGRDGAREGLVAHPRRARVLGWGLTAVLVCVVLPLVAELALRLVSGDMGVLARFVVPLDVGDSRTYALRPNAEIEFRGMQERLDEPVLWRINAQGIRADEPVGAKTERYRVLVFGDSEAFGWALPAEATFARLMEGIDPAVEVINLGIPGYNAANVADYMAEKLAEFEPDLVIYLFHQNDFDPTLTLSPTLARSHLYLYLQLAYSILDYDNVKAKRDSDEGARYLRAQIARMVASAEREDVGLLVAYLHWRYRRLFPPELRVDRATQLEGQPAWQAGFALWGGVNVQPARLAAPKLDHHMSATGHVMTAALLCKAIARGREGRCVPPGWRRNPRDVAIEAGSASAR